MSGAANEESKVNANESPADGTTRQAPPPRLRSSELLSGSREAIIEHGAEQYRLRLTSNGKLILTK